MGYFDLFSFQKEIIKNNIILSFEGQISQGILNNLVEMLKEKLAEDVELSSAKVSSHKIFKKIFAVFIELTQNIQNYSANKMKSDNSENGTCVIVIREVKDYFLIESGNFIYNDDISRLKKHIDLINSKNSDDLKTLYKETRSMPREPGKTGAGVGLIFIARKSKHPISYEIIEENENKFLTISIRIDKEY